jgi:hypothetical protein
MALPSMILKKLCTNGQDLLQRENGFKTKENPKGCPTLATHSKPTTK